MQFLSRPDADSLNFAAGRNALREVNHAHAGNLWNKDLATMHLFQATNDEAHTLIESNPEAGHARVRDGDPASFALLEKYRNHAPPAAHDVTVARATEASIFNAR